MDMQNRKWLGAGADVAIRAAFSFGMCGALAGLLYMTAQNGMADTSSYSAKQAHAATVIATLDAKPAAPQMAVDSSPASTLPDGLIRPAAPVVAEAYDIVPTKRPDIQVKPPAPSDKFANVERFDRCLPSCETRDPMIVGNGMPQQVAANEPDTFAAEPVSTPILQSAGNLLDRALDVPGAAFRKGRSVIRTVVNASL